VPFLRVIRDKRGYETTYLMHWYREGARQRSRILYVFRTPGGVRVGRESLEPAILRDIEASHPGIEFDWKSVLDNRQVVDTAPPADLRRQRKGRRRPEDGRAPAADAAAAPRAPRESREPREPRRAAATAGPARAPMPSALEGATPDEQIAFLGTWYPLVRERVVQRTSDPGRREALLALAERLNSSSWSDADQIVAGLQQAGEALERLSRVFARRRRRSRRAKGPDQPAAEVTPTAEVAPAAESTPAASTDSPPTHE